MTQNSWGREKYGLLTVSQKYTRFWPNGVRRSQRLVTTCRLKRFLERKFKVQTKKSTGHTSYSYKLEKLKYQIKWSTFTHGTRVTDKDTGLRELNAFKQWLLKNYDKHFDAHEELQ